MSSRIVTPLHESALLKSNPLRDPHVRKLVIYLPPSYDSNSNERYPVIYLLSSFLGFGSMLLSPQAWGYAIDERLDKLIGEKRMRECIVVMPDCFTRYGGSQYVNSTAMGFYEDYIVKEVVPYVDTHYRTKPDRKYRALLGKSSGGFGSLRLAVLYPDLFSAFYCSSGDMYFEYGYKPDIPKCYNAIFRAGGLEKFFTKFYEAPKKSGDMITAINIIAMSAAYSPDIQNPVGFDLPFDLITGELRNDIWQKWLRFDPVENLNDPKFAENLKKLTCLLECGSRDEYFLHIGARIFSDKLKQLNIQHSYEEFDDGHMGTSYRYDIAFEKLSEALSS